MKNDGYTGRNFNRPGFQAMLAEAEAGKIGTIIVKDMSRFCRNYLKVGFYTEILFPKKQIRFVAINNSVDSDKPQDNDFTPFLNIMNEWYAKDTSNKIKSIFLSRMNDGKRCSGSIPYGYNRLSEDKQTLVVDPVASQVVKHIFELAAEGLTPPAIARQLTEEKVLIPSAYTLQYHPEQCNRKAAYGCTSWNANTVREILSRQEYLGHTVLRKTIGTNFKTDERRFATDEERLVFEDTHEPIVDSELWEQAHRRLKHATRRIKEGTHQEECLLPGLVYCADCGSKMSYQTNYYKSGEPYHSFRCSSYGNRTVNCTIHHISDKVLYQLVLRSIQRLSSHIIADERGFAEELKSKWEAQANGKPQKQKDELQIINRRLNELDRLIGSLYETANSAAKSFIRTAQGRGFATPTVQKPISRQKKRRNALPKRESTPSVKRSARFAASPSGRPTVRRCCAPRNAKPSIATKDSLPIITVNNPSRKPEKQYNSRRTTQWRNSSRTNGQACAMSLSETTI